VILCSITGFGSDREPADRPGYDFVVQAESGLMSITGAADGPPQKVGVAIVDVLAGLNAAVAVLAALRRRDATGAGERIEVSLLDSAFASLVNVAQNALVTGVEPARYGNAHASIAPYEPLRAQDGWVAIAAANDGLFARLCDVLERPDLVADVRFASNADRVAHRVELASELEGALRTRPVDEWLGLLTEAGVPAGRIRGVQEALASARTITVEHPRAGRVELVGPAARFENSAHAPASAPPLLGEHTQEVLREAGLTDAEIDAATL
jgi:crotonobetainyl-CoA:carnitine CoA-transferase CaiB-like acyl-CoA transferase